MVRNYLSHLVGWINVHCRGQSACRHCFAPIGRVFAGIMLMEVSLLLLTISKKIYDVERERVRIMSPSLDSLIPLCGQNVFSKNKKMTNGSGCGLRIWEAQKHTDPDVDPEHWCIFIILQR